MSSEVVDADAIQRSRERYLAAQRKAKETRKAARTGKASSASSETVRNTDETSAHSERSERPSEAGNAQGVSTDRPATPETRQRSLLTNRRQGSQSPTFPAENGGRPPVWTLETLEPWKRRLLMWLQEGKSLASFCRLHRGGPSLSSWFDLRVNDAMFTEAYARAREDGADALADEIIDIADGVAEAGREDSARVNAARLAVDARKWVAAKLKPKSYAERVEQGLQVTVSGEVKHTITDEQRALALDAIIRRQMVGNASSLNEAVKMLSGPQTSAMPAMPAMIDVTPTSSEQTSQTSTTNPDQTERGPATKRG